MDFFHSQVMDTFPSEQKVVMRERAAKSYRVLPCMFVSVCFVCFVVVRFRNCHTLYANNNTTLTTQHNTTRNTTQHIQHHPDYISKMLAETPMRIVSTLLFSSIVYWMVRCLVGVFVLLYTVCIGVYCMYWCILYVLVYIVCTLHFGHLLLHFVHLHTNTHSLMRMHNLNTHNLRTCNTSRATHHVQHITSRTTHRLVSTPLPPISSSLCQSCFLKGLLVLVRVGSVYVWPLCMCRHVACIITTFCVSLILTTSSSCHVIPPRGILLPIYLLFYCFILFLFMGFYRVLFIGSLTTRNSPPHPPPPKHTAFGIMISALVPNEKIAMAISPAFLVFMMLFAGTRLLGGGAMLLPRTDDEHKAQLCVCSIVFIVCVASYLLCV